MKYCFILFFLFPIIVNSQTKTPKDFGFRHLEIDYKGDRVDILVKSNEGEENVPKPILFFIQGSGSQPLIRTDGEGLIRTFPFSTKSFTDKYHLVIVGKPNIPIIMDKKDLGKDFNLVDSNNNPPQKYLSRNYLSYYVDRNIKIIDFLQKQKWVKKNELVVMGHSEGSSISVKMTKLCPKITHLVYLSGNPFGRIMNMIGKSRNDETDSLRYSENDFKLWDETINDLNYTKNYEEMTPDDKRTLFEFSEKPIEYFSKIKVPVFIGFGTKDWNTPFIDYMRIKMIEEHKTNFNFKPYFGTEHNFFPVKSNGETDFSIYNWDKVGYDIRTWLDTN